MEIAAATNRQPTLPTVSRRAVLGAGIAAPALLGAGCARPVDVPAGTLVMAIEGNPESLHPYRDATRSGNILKRNLFDTLIHIDSDSMALGPGLATDWDERDPLDLRLEIRTDTRFHNGDPVTVDDVVFTLNHLATSARAERFTNPSAHDWIDRAERLSSTRLRILAKHPQPIRMVRLGWMPILSREFHARAGSRGLAQRPIGSGPYRIQAIVPGQQIDLARHALYRGPKEGAEIDRIEVRVLPDAETRVAELMAGAVHWDFGLTLDQAEALRRDPALVVHDSSTFRVAVLQMDATGTAGQPALADRRVRQAIAHAIDRPGIVRHLWRQSADAVLDSYCPPDLPGCGQGKVKRYAFDPARARALLAEAGYPSGFEVSLSAVSPRPDVAVIASNLRDVGLDVRVNIYPAATYARMRDSRRLQLTYTAFGGAQLGDLIAGVYDYHYTGGSRDMARDPMVAALVKEGMTTVDPVARQMIVDRLEPYLAEQMYNLPINVWSRPYVMSRRIVWAPTPDELPPMWKARWA